MKEGCNCENFNNYECCVHNPYCEYCYEECERWYGCRFDDPCECDECINETNEN